MRAKIRTHHGYINFSKDVVNEEIEDSHTYISTDGYEYK